MSWNDIAAIVIAIATVAGLNLGGLRWLLDRREKKRDEFDTSFRELAERVLILERLQQNGPTWNTVNDVKQRLASIEGIILGLKATVEGMKEEQGHQRESVRRIEGHLLRDAEE